MDFKNNSKDPETDNSGVSGAYFECEDPQVRSRQYFASQTQLGVAPGIPAQLSLGSVASLVSSTDHQVHQARALTHTYFEALSNYNYFLFKRFALNIIKVHRAGVVQWVEHMARIHLTRILCLTQKSSQHISECT